MSCEGVNESLIDLLVSSLVVDTNGYVYFNVELSQSDCEDLEAFLTCNNNHTKESLLQEAFDEDSCGLRTLRFTIPDDLDLNVKDLTADTFFLNKTVWDDLRAPASGINPVGSPSAATPNTSDGSLTFSKGNVAIAWFQLPHSYKEGTDLHFHIHWSKSTTNNGLVHWQMKYKWANIGDVMPAFNALSDGTVLISDSNTVDKHAMVEWDDLDGTGKTMSSMICIYLSRTNDGDDTFTGNANLYEMDIHYEIDSIGSREELIK